MSLKISIPNIFAGFLAILLSSSTFASESWNQIEVAASSGKNLNLVGIAEKRNLSEYSSPMRCALVASNENGLSNTYRFRDEGYDFSANPTVAVSPKTGDGYAVCMSVKKDYSKGQLDLFKYETKINKWSRIATPIEKMNGIPDKPVIAIAEDGTALVAYLDVSKNNSKLKSRLKLFQLGIRGQILKEFGLEAQVGNETSFGIDGQQGADLIYDKIKKRFLLSYGTYGGKEAFICVLDLENETCKKQVKINTTALEVPITRLAVSKSGDVGLTTYDAHIFGDGAAFRLDADSLTALSEESMKNVAMVTPFFKDDQFKFFYLQQGDKDLYLNTGDNCRISIGTRFEKNDYLGAYASTISGPKDIVLLVPTPQARLKNIRSGSCSPKDHVTKAAGASTHGVQ